MTSEVKRRRGMGLMPLAYRVEDAAAAIGISRSTLFEYINHGRFPSRKIGGSTVIETVRNSVCGRRVEHQAAMARVKRSPKMTANCALAMTHSRRPIFHAFSERFKTR